MRVGECKICKGDKELAGSHIIPEFCYSSLYDENHKMLGITGKAPKPAQKVQKGLKESLLCVDCEEYRNRTIEQPYQREWDRANIISRKAPTGSNIDLLFDFEIFRKFHLSILFLASVAKAASWSNVSLGRHEDVLRKYVKGETELPVWMYPVSGIVAVRADGTVENRIVSPPAKFKLSGATCYALTFCGVRWFYSVSSHANQELLAESITPSGKISLPAALWEDFRSVQDMGTALRVNNP